MSRSSGSSPILSRSTSRYYSRSISKSTSRADMTTTSGSRTSCSDVQKLSSSTSREASRIKYILSQSHLEFELVEAGSKLVVISFLLLGNESNEKMLQFITEKAAIYKDSTVVLVVDVTKFGELAKNCEAVQIPWFAFIRNGRKLEDYHTIDCHRIGKTIRHHLGEDSMRAFSSYIKDDFDLSKRLVDAKNNLVVLAFLIPGDISGERVNIDLDEIDDRHDDVDVFKVDVDTCKDVTAKFHVQGVPTIVFIKNGVVFDQINAIEIDRLGQTIAKYTQEKQIPVTQPSPTESLPTEQLPTSAQEIKGVQQQQHLPQDLQQKQQEETTEEMPHMTKRIAFEDDK